MLHRHSTDPTERSMPPVMMTIVMPSAMIATKVKLRVTLNRLFGVANKSVANDRKMPAPQTAMKTQNAWLDVSQATQSAWSCFVRSSTTVAIAEPCRLLQGVLDRAGDQPGDFLE